jgi:hypothetical protein
MNMHGAERGERACLAQAGQKMEQDGGIQPPAEGDEQGAMAQMSRNMAENGLDQVLIMGVHAQN